MVLYGPQNLPFIECPLREVPLYMCVCVCVCISDVYHENFSYHISRLLMLMIWIYITIWRHIHYLRTCKSHANHNEEAGKHAGYNNELYMTWYYLVEGSYDNSDSSEAINIQSLIFRKPKSRAKVHIVSHLIKIGIKNYLYHIILQTLISWCIFISSILHVTALYTYVHISVYVYTCVCVYICIDLQAFTVIV